MELKMTIRFKKMEYARHFQREPLKGQYIQQGRGVYASRNAHFKNENGVSTLFEKNNDSKNMTMIWVARIRADSKLEERAICRKAHTVPYKNTFS